MLGCKGNNFLKYFDIRWSNRINFLIENWKDLCHKSMIHGGDSDSTGCIAAGWYGALYGFKEVNDNNHKVLIK